MSADPLLSRVPACYAGFLKRNPDIDSSSDKEYIYYADFNKRWEFYCSYDGARRLVDLFNINEPCIEYVQSLINASPTPTIVEKEGEEIYSRKPNKKYGSVTWSQEEYRHPGFLKQYLTLKSIQRYAETYALYERAHNYGYFQAYINREKECPEGQTPHTVRMISFGGGPGYELLAFSHFMKIICPRTPVDIVSFDLEASWETICTKIGVRFAVWDMFLDKKSIQDVLREMYVKATNSTAVPYADLHVDFFFSSYAFQTYVVTEAQRAKIVSLLITNPFLGVDLSRGHELTEELSDFAKTRARGFSPYFNMRTPLGGFSVDAVPSPVLLGEQLSTIDLKKEFGIDRLNTASEQPFPGPPHCLFINDRFQMMSSLSSIEFKYKDCVKVVRLITQSKERDDRQTILCSRSLSTLVSLFKTNQEMFTVFPNQPYEEHKGNAKHKYKNKAFASAKSTDRFKKVQSKQADS